MQRFLHIFGEIIIIIIITIIIIIIIIIISITYHVSVSELLQMNVR